MNPFLNPIFTSKAIKNYITGVKRAWKSPEKIKKYQDKALKKALKYAYKVPIYRKKYNEAGLDINDISGIDDLYKIPIMTKEELIKGYPNGIIPDNYNKNKAYEVGTSGSSGRPVTIYKDMMYIITEAISGIRIMKITDTNWRKTKITNIGDFTVPTTTDEEALKKALIGNLSTFFSLKNYQMLYTGEEIRSLLKKTEAFEPELIIGYTSVLMGLASLKNKGLGKKIKPKYIISSGEVLDSYTRKYIEEAFNARVLNVYATTEGGTIAIECLNGSLHINSDFVHLEVLDKKGQPVNKNKFGSVVITRLYPGGTPIIRYSGQDDIAILDENPCDCSMNTPIIKSLQGRKKDAIILPDGRVFPPATIPMPIADAAGKFNTYQIKRFQFIQKNIDDIEIKVVIDEEQRDKGVKVEELLKEIKNNYKKLVGEKVKIEVNEVKKVEKTEGTNSPPLIISNLNKKKIEEILL